jgi:hypothetical protein
MAQVKMINPAAKAAPRKRSPAKKNPPKTRTVYRNRKRSWMDDLVDVISAGAGAAVAAKAIEMIRAMDADPMRRSAYDGGLALLSIVGMRFLGKSPAARAALTGVAAMAVVDIFRAQGLLDGAGAGLGRVHLTENQAATRIASILGSGPGRSLGYLQSGSPVIGAGMGYLQSGSPYVADGSAFVATTY